MKTGFSYKLILVLASLIISTNGWAKYNDAAGIEVPDQIEGLQQVPSGNPDNSLDSVYNFSGSGNEISIYIFRATHPNAALWFERADSLLQLVQRQRGLGEAGAQRMFSFAGATKPNGLARVYKMTGKSKSTALAVGEVNGWIVKVRLTSDNLETEQLSARMDRVLASLKAKTPADKVHPLILPDLCEKSAQQSSFNMENSSIIPKPKPETILAVGVMLAGHAASTSGGPESLASKPEAYCRQSIANESPIAMMYRPKANDSKDWIILFADSGRSISGASTPTLEKKTKDGFQTGGVLIANTLESANALVILEDVPSPEIGLAVGGNFIVQGGSAPLASAGFGKDSGVVSLNSDIITK